MGMFVDTSRIAVTADGEIDVAAVTPEMDVIYIRKRMDLGTVQKVVSAMAKINSGAKNDDEETSAGLNWDIGAYQLALAEHNIVGWSGPSFEGVPCTAKNIRRLDPAEPIVTATLNAIGERNAGALMGMTTGTAKKSTLAGAVNGVASS